MKYKPHYVREKQNQKRFSDCTKRKQHAGREDSMLNKNEAKRENNTA